MYEKILKRIISEISQTTKELELRGIEKYGFYASAFFLQHIISKRMIEKNDAVRSELENIVEVCAIVIAQCTDTTLDDVVKRQTELYIYKNARYGNSFKECYADFGWQYSVGHLKEKINRICSLLMSGEEDSKESILDSYKDLLGYSVLYLMEYN